MNRNVEESQSLRRFIMTNKCVTGRARERQRDCETTRRFCGTFLVFMGLIEKYGTNRERERQTDRHRERQTERERQRERETD
eukprot:COSAG02_NODE_52269_length_309_cov_0.271429_1_plen_81_part_10